MSYPSVACPLTQAEAYSLVRTLFPSTHEQMIAHYEKYRTSTYEARSWLQATCFTAAGGTRLRDLKCYQPHK